MVVHAHTIFWSGMSYMPDWSRRLNLVLDVTIFFFISGFLIASGPAQSVVRRFLRQVKGILVPYLAIGLAALSVSTSAKVLAHGSVGLEGFATSLGSLFYLMPEGRGWEMWMVFPGSMWFIRNYLIAMPVLVILLVTPARRWLPVGLGVLLLVLAALGTGFVPAGGAIRTDGVAVATGALMFLILGAWFRDKLWNTWTLRHSAWVFAGWLVAMVLVFRAFPFERLTDLPYSKFPPTWTYLLICLFLIQATIVLAVVERTRGLAAIPAVVRRGLGWCGRYTFEIFLIQGLATSIPERFVGALLQRGFPAVSVYSIALTWNLVATLVGTWCLVRIRQAMGSWWQARKKG